MPKLLNKINNATTFLAGAVTYHLVDRILYYPSEVAEEAKQQAMAAK